jgi:hypothetical protein
VLARARSGRDRRRDAVHRVEFVPRQAYRN